jgi:hypothetical protein
VVRDGVDGEMISKVQNGVSEVKISDSSAAEVTKPVAPESIKTFDHFNTSTIPTPEENVIKSHVGVRNMQESTLDKERKYKARNCKSFLIFICKTHLYYSVLCLFLFI